MPRLGDQGRRGGRAAVVAGLLAFLVGLPVAGLAHPGGPTCAPRSPPPAQTPLAHLFFIIKENHAFENYFGDLPGVTGFPPNASLPATYGSSVRVSSHPIGSSSTTDLPHDRASALADLDGGRMDGFVAQAAADRYGNPADAVGYYTAAQIAPYWADAREFALADHFISGVLGPTLPNRVYDMAGQTGNWTSDELPPAGTLDFPTILDQLSASGIPWAYDYSGTRQELVPLLFPSLANSACAQAAIVPVGGLAAQLAAPVAPSVVFIDPSHSLLYSEHPPGNVTLGALWTSQVIDTIAHSPVGRSSAIFVYYDEYGGFWDPVAPPTTSAVGDGFRVPLLVLSPYTPAGTRVSTPMDPASLLHFIDANWGLFPLDAEVAHAALPSAAFDFAMPPRPLPVTPSNVTLGAPSGVPGDTLARAIAPGPLGSAWLIGVGQAPGTVPTPGSDRRRCRRDRHAVSSTIRATRPLPGQCRRRA